MERNTKITLWTFIFQLISIMMFAISKFLDGQWLGVGLFGVLAVVDVISIVLILKWR